MPITPNQRFKDFLTDIEPSGTTVSKASKAHTDLRKALRADETFSTHHKSDFLSGSYKRQTAIRPRLENGQQQRPDVDIVVVTHHSLADDPEAVVDLVFDAIKRANYTPVHRQDRSVNVETPNAEMDVVPLIEPFEGVFYIPDRTQSEWILTNPPGHTTWTTQRNEQASGRFKPNVKLFKWWRRHNRTLSKRPKGFILEVMAADHMDNTERHFGELFVRTLEGIVDAYQADINLGLVPYIEDPSLSGSNIITGIEIDHFDGFFKKVKAHAKIGREALEADDEDTATKKWHTLFGDRFPSCSSTSKSALTPETVTTSGLTFPNRPVKPSKKPKGFA